MNPVLRTLGIILVLIILTNIITTILGFFQFGMQDYGNYLVWVFALVLFYLMLPSEVQLPPFIRN